MAELVKIISKQKDIIVRNKGKLNFEFHFKAEPIEMQSDIAEFLMKDNPNFVRYEEKKKSKKEVKKE